MSRYKQDDTYSIQIFSGKLWVQNTKFKRPDKLKIWGQCVTMQDQITMKLTASFSLFCSATEDHDRMKKGESHLMKITNSTGQNSPQLKFLGDNDHKEKQSLYTNHTDPHLPLNQIN